MSKNTTNSDTQTVSPASNADAVKAKAATLADKVTAEINAIDEARKSFFAACRATGDAGLTKLAERLGMSVDKLGYPGHSEYLTFSTVCVLQKTDHTKFDQLARHARNAIGSDPDRPAMSKDEIAEAQKRFLTGTAKNSNGNASKAAMKIKTPRAQDVALGGS